jgi:predicted metal-dependent hydrolase
MGKSAICLNLQCYNQTKWKNLMKTNHDKNIDNFRMGLANFNHGNYYQAHEYFEDAWRETPGPNREFYRALLHISGGFFRLTEGRPQAARKFFEHALKWLVEFEPNYLGFNISKLKKGLEEILELLVADSPPELIIKEHLNLFIPDYGEVSK